MKVHWMGPAILALSLAMLVVPATEAAMVAKMDLGDLTDNAHRIFRATVMDVEQSAVTVGGGELPAVVVTLRVDEVLKGDFAPGKDGQVVEIKMLGSVKDDANGATYQRISVLPDMPKLSLGSDYLLFTTEPSAVGLSTTVGLGQGSFRIYTADKQEMAANELNNAGLFSGAVTYATLTAAVGAELGE